MLFHFCNEELVIFEIIKTLFNYEIISLFFDGKAEEAMNFYVSILDAEITNVMRFNEAPPEMDCPPEIENHIMHAHIKFGENEMMFSDSAGREPHVTGNHITLSIYEQDREKGKSILDKLSDGGKVMMPFNEVFWGGMFGMCIDKYGVQWMVSSN